MSFKWKRKAEESVSERCDVGKTQMIIGFEGEDLMRGLDATPPKNINTYESKFAIITKLVRC